VLYMRHINVGHVTSIHSKVLIFDAFKHSLPLIGMYNNTSSRPDTADSITSFSMEIARPRTGHSMTTRPATARPTTAASTTRHEASYVVALLEGRGVSREIGMAALDKDTGICVLVQV
jgi:DNA mismatch repair protein MSH4